MKSRSQLSMACAGFLFIAAPFSVADTPYIVHLSDSGNRGTLSVSGGGYDPATVRAVVHIPGPKTSERESLPELVATLANDYDGTPTSPPATPPRNQTHIIKPLHASEHSVFVRLPAHPYSSGYVAFVWLQDGETMSRPFVLNEPRAWFLMKPTSRPGELNRLCGFNLSGDRYAPRYVFLRSADGRVKELSQVPRHKEDGFSEDFCIQFQIPVDQPAGKYLVFAHNNSGHAHGFTQTLPLEITTDPDFPQRIYKAVEHVVAGDTFTDDLPALQKLIDRVGEDGGGIVYLQPGSYRLNDTLQLRANVVLRGAGIDATTIFFGGAPHENKRARWLISARGVNHTGIEDLTVRISSPLDYALSYYDGGKPTYDTHLRRCRFSGGQVGIAHNVNMEIGNCEFDGRLHATNIERGWIHDNEFTLGRLRGSPVAIWSSEHCTFEHNRAYGSNRGFVWQNHGILGHYRNFIDANVVEDARMGGNAGETFLFEGSGFQWNGKPSEIRADGIAAADAGWKPGGLVNSFAVVTAGRGLGQYRRISSNDERSFSLTEPWRVRPSGDVRVSVMRGMVENAICNNRHVDSDNSMMFYASGMINNRIVRNRSENTLGISIWSRAEAAKSVLVPDYYNIFDGNVCEDQGGFWLTRMSDLNQKDGIRSLNNIFRNNFLADVRRKRENQYHNVWEERRHGSYRPIQAAIWMDIGRSYDSDPQLGPIWIDTLIEDNYFTRCDLGVELRGISGGTVVRENTFFDVRRPILDEGVNTVISDNRIEYPPTDEKKPTQK